MCTEASCEPRAPELTVVQVQLKGPLRRNEGAINKKVKLTNARTIFHMVEQTDPIMKIKHTNGTKDGIDEEVDRVPSPMLNLLVDGKFLYRIEALAAVRAQ